LLDGFWRGQIQGLTSGESVFEAGGIDEGAANRPRRLGFFHIACSEAGLPSKFCGVTLGEFGCMWEQLTPADIERAKHRLANQRIEALTRHAEELKALDTERAEMEDLERAVAAFASKHLTAAASTASPIVTVAGESTPAAGSSESRAPGDVYPPRLQVHHETSPNFGMPFRRLVGG